MESMGLADVVDRSEIPKGVKIWSTRWVHRKKGGTVRSRFVVRQFRDSDAGDCYANTPRGEAIRVLITIAMQENFVLQCGDFSVAFMHTPIGTDEWVVVMPPEELNLHTKVWRLRKALYGLKEAARRFQDFLAKVLVNGGYERSVADPTLFHHTKNRTRAAIHVNDPLLCGPMGGIDAFFDLVSQTFKCKREPVWGPEPVPYLGAMYSRLCSPVDMVIEDSRPEYIENTLRFAGLDLKGRSVGTTGMRVSELPEAKIPL
eukprot:1056088-Amphidinium_carterae.1